MGSQYNEDDLLARLLPETGRYLDVGCSDPELLSNTYKLYQKGWRGVCVDMRDTPEMRTRWQEVRPQDQLILGQAAGEPHAHLQVWGQGDTASLIPKWGEQSVCGEKVTTKGLHEFWPEPEPPTLLCLDVEGAEGFVLLGNDWGQLKPKFIIAEAIEYRTYLKAYRHWEPILFRHGYSFVAASPLNRIYQC